MKIWRSFSVDHSAKLKIIGSFKTPQNAEEAANAFNALKEVPNKNKVTCIDFLSPMHKHRDERMGIIL